MNTRIIHTVYQCIKCKSNGVQNNISNINKHIYLLANKNIYIENIYINEKVNNVSNRTKNIHTIKVLKPSSIQIIVIHKARNPRSIQIIVIHKARNPYTSKVFAGLYILQASLNPKCVSPL